jgi:hypothetical protein
MSKNTRRDILRTTVVAGSAAIVSWIGPRTAVAETDSLALHPVAPRTLSYFTPTEFTFIEAAVTRYRHLREISKQHHSAALDFLSKDTIISQARRIGLAQGKTLILDSMDDLNLAFDLAIHTAPKDRSRAIDRYARAARLAPESDEALVLEAMRRARFSIISIVRRHAVTGLIVEDLFRGVEFWLVDERLESSLPDGAALATRLYTPEGFAMTAGVLVPLDVELMEDAIADTPQLLRNRREELIDDRRFAEAIYRVALASGLMAQVAYQDTIAESG